MNRHLFLLAKVEGLFVTSFLFSKNAYSLAMSMIRKGLIEDPELEQRISNGGHKIHKICSAF